MSWLRQRPTHTGPSHPHRARPHRAVPQRADRPLPSAAYLGHCLKQYGDFCLNVNQNPVGVSRGDCGHHETENGQDGHRHADGEPDAAEAGRRLAL